MTVPNKGHARLRGIKASRKRKTGYVRFTRAEESWSPQFPKITTTSTIFKALLIIAIAIPVSLVPAYGYYSNIYLPSITPQQPDPFTTLWNGQLSSSVTTGTPTVATSNQTQSASCSSSSCTTTLVLTVTAGDRIMFTGSISAGVSVTFTVTDTLSNTYSLITSTGAHQIFSALSASGGKDTITLVGGCNACGSFFDSLSATDVTNSAGIGNSNHVTFNPALPATVSIAVTTQTNSMVYQSISYLDNNGPGCGGTTSANGQTKQVEQCIVVGGANGWEQSAWSKSSLNSGSNSFGITISDSGGNANGGMGVVELTPNPNGPCVINTAWACQNAFMKNGDMILTPNSTEASVVLSTSAVDFSTAASKAIAYSEQSLPTFSNDTNTLHTFVGEEYGWYLTLNSTIPTQKGYNPLSDNAVVLLVSGFVLASNSYDYYIYMQRQAGQTLSLGTDDPISQCQQSSTLFICAHTTASPNQLMSAVLNFTGGSSGGSCNSNGLGASCSYFCGNIGVGAATCSLGGNQNSAVSFASTSLYVNYTQPWLNLQNQYHVGFWMKAASTPFATKFYTSGISGGLNQNVFSIYLPTPLSNGVQDTGGFFGWVGRALGGAWNAAAGALAPITSPILGLGNSILATIISGLIQFVNLLVIGAVTAVTLAETEIQSVMNAIGQFIGWGNIGTQFFSFANGVITYFTTGLSDALGWLLRLIQRSIDLIKTANFWVNFYLNGLLNFMADALNLISEVVVFATKITTFVGSSYAFIVILFFLWYTADMGLAGVHAWFETMKWLAFISFDFLERMINFGISSVTWLFGRIPTLDGTTLPELPTIAIGGGPIWPTTEMTALREGNFFAYFGQMVGVAFLIYFESSGLPGSIGSNVTGTAAGAMAPFVTILLILISITGFLFILNIPAKMARGAFGLDDLKPTSLSKFSTGPIGTGGVSGHFVRRHPQRKARIVVNRGLGVRGLRPHLRRPKTEFQGSSAGVG